MFTPLFSITLLNDERDVTAGFNESELTLEQAGQEMASAAEQTVSMIVERLEADPSWADRLADQVADGDFVFRVAVTRGKSDGSRVLYIETGKHQPDGLRNLAAARTAHRALLAGAISFAVRAAAGE